MSRRFATHVAAGALLFAVAFGAGAQDAASTRSADTAFIQHAAADGLAEIQMGNLALQQSANPAVKELARRIVSDHTKANAELGTVAQARQVDLPTAPDQDAQEMAGTLRGLDGARFDRAWAAAMVQDHQKAVAMFSAEARASASDEVQDFATQTLPTLKTHLELARQLQGSLGASTSEGD